MKNQDIILKNGRLVTENGIVDNSYVVAKDGKIIEIGTYYSKDDGVDLQGNFILPGFIDQHTHGGYGCDFSSKEEVMNFSENLIKEGVTSYLPTIMTLPTKRIKETVDIIYNCRNSQRGSNVLGVHLEGPFISSKYKGAQNEDYIIPPNFEILKDIFKGKEDFRKILTYAPEEATLEFTSLVNELGIVPSVGHSNADLETIRSHMNSGLKSITHFQNSHSPHHHREPGITSAGFLFDIYTELIVDGIHINKDIVKMIYKIKGRDRIILVTDSIHVKGLDDGKYCLSGQEVIKKSNEVRLSSGSLSGSILKMNDAIKNMMKFTGCSINDIMIMASKNPAELLNVNKGKVEVGFDADITILDSEFNVEMVIVGGIEKYGVYNEN
ncbi:N-acetylglucosamine-6-phosphate deacetylase [Mycoplasmatota bacterium]|nr:N-acetylglucosamine-6-phosphate deacetylase [Mycoplasmatota bacterium]